MDRRIAPEEDRGESVRLLIRPNRSLSPKGMALLAAAFAVICITIGVGFSLAGAWLVLPFAGLEVIVVAAALYFLYRHSGDYELILIEAQRVRVIRRHGQEETSQDFQRYWVKVVLTPPQAAWDPSHLALGSHGRYVEVGAELSEPDRQLLARRLRHALQHPM